MGNHVGVQLLGLTLKELEMITSRSHIFEVIFLPDTGFQLGHTWKSYMGNPPRWSSHHDKAHRKPLYIHSIAIFVGTPSGLFRGVSGLVFLWAIVRRLYLKGAYGSLHPHHNNSLKYQLSRTEMIDGYNGLGSLK